jgi:hypothetical protein
MLSGPNKLNIKVHKVYPLAEAAQAQTVRRQTLTKYVSSSKLTIVLSGPGGKKDQWEASSEAVGKPMRRHVGCGKVATETSASSL